MGILLKGLIGARPVNWLAIRRFYRAAASRNICGKRAKYFNLLLGKRSLADDGDGLRDLLELSSDSEPHALRAAPILLVTASVLVSVASILGLGAAVAGKKMPLLAFGALLGVLVKIIFPSWVELPFFRKWGLPIFLKVVSNKSGKKTTFGSTSLAHTKERTE